jgi:hypothetical protein
VCSRTKAVITFENDTKCFVITRDELLYDALIAHVQQFGVGDALRTTTPASNWEACGLASKASIYHRRNKRNPRGKIYFRGGTN